METKRLAGLEPAAVFHYFEEICAIPHGSRNTKKISDYLVDFAKEHGLRCIQDASNNVILFGNGTCGMEDHAPVILQGHMDMVCEKDMDCPLDMEKEGLDVTHDDKFVFAKGTTLGGDDGIAVAYALALLADDISLPAERKAVYGPCVRLSVDGLQGGHSGAEIHKNRANANKVMGEFMDRIQKLMPLCLTSLSGGTKDNAIPRSCQATLVAMGIQLERINAVAEELQAEIREKYDEPDAVIQAFDVDALGGNGLSTQATAKVIGLLCAAPNGVQARSKDIEGLVQTSLNMGITKLGERFNVTFSVRSSVNSEKEDLL